MSEMPSEKTLSDAVRPMVHKYRANSLTGMSLIISSDSARCLADTLEDIAERADAWRSLVDKSRVLDRSLPSIAIWIFAAGFGFGLVTAAIMEMSQ